MYPPSLLHPSQPSIRIDLDGSFSSFFFPFSLGRWRRDKIETEIGDIDIGSEEERRQDVGV